jgi:hypothetical protein
MPSDCLGRHQLPNVWIATAARAQHCRAKGNVFYFLYADHSLHRFLLLA